MHAMRIAIVLGLIAGWLAMAVWAAPPAPNVTHDGACPDARGAMAPIYYPLLASNGAMPIVGPTPTPTSFPGVASDYGVIVPVEASICMAGETHHLQGAGVYLYSDVHGVDLALYEGAYVQVWGRMVESPECKVMAVLAIAEFVPPVP